MEEAEELMAAARKLPDDQTLKRLLNQGMTYQDIADWTLEHQGAHVTWRAVSVYVSRNRDRLGVPLRRPRYSDMLPWRVQERHAKHYAVRMLRLESRRQAGEVLSEELAGRLESWKAWMEENNTVIHYEPNSPEGFYDVPRLPGDGELIRPPYQGEERRAMASA